MYRGGWGVRWTHRERAVIWKASLTEDRSEWFTPNLRFDYVSFEDNLTFYQIFGSLASEVFHNVRIWFTFYYICAWDPVLDMFYASHCYIICLKFCDFSHKKLYNSDKRLYLVSTNLNKAKQIPFSTNQEIISIRKVKIEFCTFFRGFWFLFAGL